MNITIGCPCPGQPHPDGDTVTLRDRLDFVSGKAIRTEVGLLYGAGDVSEALMWAKLSEQYILFGVSAWTLLDGAGKPLAPSRANLLEYLAEHPVEGEQLADAADGLYSAAVVAPLVARASTSSPPTPTDGSTSPTIPSSPTPPRPLRPSSTTSSPTDATVTTSASPDGASSSSQSSASAA